MLKNPLTYEIMTPKSVGVPDSKLVLGKHSGRHALGLRCEQLGYQFDRRELDEVYRRFVVLADQIKHVADHHLLDLIRETRLDPRQASAETGKTEPEKREAAAAASAVVAGGAAPKPLPAGLPTEMSSVSLPLNSMAEHHNEQDDYLWGV
jgi:isopropylmalate/homocitrate/citramalate synthase